jgi:hypothetical protein
MSTYRDDAIITETLERIRRAELATVLYPPGTPEHMRAVERLDRATRQMNRLERGRASDGALPPARDPREVTPGT